MYEYRAFVRKVYDGDTIYADIDLGSGVELKNQPIRLIGVNAPEISGEAPENGLKSRDALSGLIFNKWVWIKTVQDKKDKYDRWLGEIFIDKEDESINKWLLKEGYAEEYRK